MNALTYTHPAFAAAPLRFVANPASQTEKAFSPAVDVLETENAFEFYILAAGMNKEDFKIEAQNKTLKISGERKSPEIEKAQWLRREIKTGTFERAFRLPLEADPAKVEAVYQNGVLKITVGKQEKTLVNVIAVN